nr:immunoglobulin heavy chain junction region [Macaca mulatta]MOW32732.1 immunoglobulin heavy chain junction region [Macaca mulatta]MOW33260.1 immunoglobulin heavy chain junction region [Macaca mulatta]
CHGRYGGNDFW